MIRRQHRAGLFAGLVLASITSPAQTDGEKVDWLKANGRELRSVQSSAQDDYSDLFWLGQALKDVRVVALGEAAHGDGTTFAMKARLVRYLHQQLGFDVIAWESNLFDVWNMEAALRDPSRPPREAARQGIFGVWTAAEQLLPLWDYLRESKSGPRPIDIAGFDIRIRPAAARYLREFFVRAGQTQGNEKAWDRFEQAVAAQTERIPEPGEYYTNPLYDESFINGQLARLADRRAEFRRVWSERDIEFAQRLLMTDQYYEWYLREELGGKRPPAFTRDMGMGLNLLWLVEKRYPDRKVIVWAATGHLMNDFVPSPQDANFRIAGLRGTAFAPVKHVLGPQAYSLVFLSSEGRSGYTLPPLSAPFDIPAPPAGSLGALCRDTSRPIFFVDFMSLPSDHWLRQPLMAAFRWHGHNFSAPTGMTRDWTQRHDGMIYIRRMEPCVVIPPTPAQKP